MSITGHAVAFSLSILISFVLANSVELRNPGDVLYSQCRNLTYNGMNFPNSCIILSEGADCGLNVALSVAGTNILSENMDLSVVPSVCGTYSGCQLCVEIIPNPTNPNQRCVQIAPKCAVFSPAPSNIGCFPNSVLADVIACEANKCPNNCNGHGTCASGVCTCDDNWYGDDCNTTGALFDACQRVDSLGADVCVRLDFDECNIVTKIVVEGNGQELEIFSQAYSVEDFKSVFQTDQCADIGVCSICLSWANLVLTEVKASGCGSINLDCLGTEYAYPLGCFRDDTVVPKCFGTCPKNCSYNGYCYRGICQCIDGYTSKDCSQKICQPADCSGHGVCINGQCKCEDKWGNADCNTYVESGHSKKGISLMVVLVPVCLIVAIGGAAVVIWVVKRHHNKQPGHKFTQLELMDDEEDHNLVDDDDK